MKIDVSLEILVLFKLYYYILNLLYTSIDIHLFTRKKQRSNKEEEEYVVEEKNIIILNYKINAVFEYIYIYILFSVIIYIICIYIINNIMKYFEENYRNDIII